MDHLLILLRLCIDLAFGFAFWGELRKLPRRSLPLFACPKKSNQKKRHPGSALLLRSSALRCSPGRARPKLALLRSAQTLGRFIPSRLRFSALRKGARSEEQTSELQSLMSLSYAVFCLKKKTSIP